MISTKTRYGRTAPALSGNSSPDTAASTRIIATPLPNHYLGIDYNLEQLLGIRFLTPSTANTTLAGDADLPSFTVQLITDLEHYFTNPKTPFHTRARAPSGTAFQQRVWQAISTIPCGETRSYGQLAELLETAPRAVGGACRANPLPLVVPCHRVIASTSGNGGFLGQSANQGMSANIKQWLLDHERR